MFKELTPPNGERHEPGDDAGRSRARTVLAEIDEIARATFSSITLATMLRLLERQQRDAPTASSPPVGGSPAMRRVARRA